MNEKHVGSQKFFEDNIIGSESVDRDWMGYWIRSEALVEKLILLRVKLQSTPHRTWEENKLQSSHYTSSCNGAAGVSTRAWHWHPLEVNLAKPSGAMLKGFPSCSEPSLRNSLSSWKETISEEIETTAIVLHICNYQFCFEKFPVPCLTLLFCCCALPIFLRALCHLPLSSTILCEQTDHLTLWSGFYIHSCTGFIQRRHITYFTARLGFSSRSSAKPTYCQVGFQCSDWFLFSGKRPSVLHSSCPAATGRDLILSSIMLEFGTMEHFLITYELKRNLKGVKTWNFNTFHIIIYILNYVLMPLLKCNGHCGTKQKNAYIEDVVWLLLASVQSSCSHPNKMKLVRIPAWME